MAMTRTDLEEQYSTILGRSSLSPEEQRLVVVERRSAGTFVLQASSGSTRLPLLIPRSLADVADIARRVAQPFVSRFGRAPARIALIGGISHTEAALKMEDKNMSMQSFQTEQLAEVLQFDPDVISCYPGILREILPLLPTSASLLCVKLGGERILPADLTRAFERFPELLLVEQLGSTEMPAIAVRAFSAENRQEPYRLQTARFTFQLPQDDGWHPVIVKDNFPGQLFPIGDFYDTGDDLLWKNGEAVEVRRRGDPAAGLYPDFNRLLEAGCSTVQLHEQTNELWYTGPVTLDPAILFGGKEVRTVRQAAQRIQPSNKTPPVIRP